MMFYNCNARLADLNACDEIKDPAEKPARYISYSDIMFEHYEHDDKKVYCFAVDISGGIIKTGMISGDVLSAGEQEKLIKEYCGMAGFELAEFTRKDELTFGELRSLLNLA